MKKYLSLLLCLVMIFSLAACGNSGSDDGGDAASADKIVKIGRNMANTQNLDVWTTTLTPVFQISDAVFDRLYDKNPETMELELNLLADWPEISEDRTVYTFKLKEGVKFHDGSDLTSEDVEFTFNYFYDRDTASTNTWVCGVIKGCEEMMAGEADTLEGFKVIDEHTFSIELMYPYGAFESVLATSMLPILPSDARIAAGDTWGLDTLIGSGPYKLVSFEPAESVELAVNPDYHGNVPNVDGIKMMNMDTSTAIMEWEAGNIDFCDVSNSQVADVESKYPDNLQSQVMMGSVRFQLNQSMAPLDDVNVRKAIAMAIDKSPLIDGYLEGRANPLYGCIPEGIPGWVDDSEGAVAYDPEGAKKLLEESGYPDGVTFDAVVRESSDSFKYELQILQDMLKEAGITMEIVQVDSASYTEMRNNNKMQSMLADWYADFVDADMYLYTLFHSDYSNGYSCANNDEWFDEQVELARTMSVEEKGVLYEQLDKYLANEVFAFVPLYQEKQYCLCSDRLEGVFLKKDCLYTFRDASITN
ncbi:MAG: ABC transporter substrate-binding protein [Firmicutes bacterium]|nr:ABC transporter substrate-binding protein [Bacillota bacterium]